MNELTTTQDTPQPIAAASVAMMMDPQQMNALVVFSKMMADAALTVPKHLQGKPSDCLAIAMQAAQWGMNPFAVAQKTHLVNGTLGYEAQLVNAVVQNSGFVESAPTYEYRGEGLGLECRVAFVLRGQTDLKWGQWLRSGDVKTKNSPLWQVNPAQQLGYLQVKNWARAYCPGAILGVYSDDELVDFTPPGARDMGQVEEVMPTGPRRKSEAPALAAEPSPAIQQKTIDNETGEILQPTNQAATQAAPRTPQSTTAGDVISSNQVAYLRNKLKQAGVDEATIVGREGRELSAFDGDTFDRVKTELVALI